MCKYTSIRLSLKGYRGVISMVHNQNDSFYRYMETEWWTMAIVVPKWASRWIMIQGYTLLQPCECVPLFDWLSYVLRLHFLKQQAHGQSLPLWETIKATYPAERLQLWINLSTVSCKTAVSPVRKQWGYCRPALSRGWNAKELCVLLLSIINTATVSHSCMHNDNCVQTIMCNTLSWWNTHTHFRMIASCCLLGHCKIRSLCGIWPQQ